MIDNPFFYLAAVPAVILVGLAKGGFAGIGILSLPLLALVAPPVEAAAVMLPILMVQDGVSLWAYWRKWDVRNLAILLPGAAFGVLLGYLLAAKVSIGAFDLSLGLISIVFAMRYFVGKNAPSKQAGVTAGSLWGVVAGFTSMVAHAGGPPFQIYVLPQRLSRDTFVGTSIAFFAVVNWMKLPGFLALGAITSHSLGTTALLLPLAVASTWAGILLVRRVDESRLYGIIYGLLILVGLKLASDGFALL
jgi:uncharacterized membrane protein YfcA